MSEQTATRFIRRQIQKSFVTAIRLLKRRKLFKSLSGYLMIGAAQVGKTTLLQQGNFEQLTFNGPITWWHHAQTLIIELPNDYLMDDDAWLETLQQLKKWRLLAGIVMVINAADLGEMTSVAPIIKTWQHRLLALQQCGSSAMIDWHIIVNQMDKITGFTTYFDDSSLIEKESVLGMTFASEWQQSWAMTFERLFNELIQNLQRRLLWRLHHEPDDRKRRVILALFINWLTLKTNLYQIFHGLQPLSDYLLLRDLHFASANPNDNKTTIDRTQNILNRQLQLAIVHDKKSFGSPLFVKKLLHFIPRSTLSSYRHRYLILSIIGFITILFTTLLFSKYRQQSDYLQQAHQALIYYQRLPANRNLGNLVARLQILHLAQINWTKAQGIFYGAPNDLLQQRDQQLLQQMRTTLQQQIKAQFTNNTTTLTNTALYSLLKAYLMLGNAIKLQPAWLLSWSLTQWHNPLLTHYLAQTLKLSTTIVTIDPNLVTTIRAQLNGLPYSELSQAIFQQNWLTTTQPNLPDTVKKQFLLPRPIPNIFYAQKIEFADQQINDAIKMAIEGDEVLGKKVDQNLSAAAIKNLRLTLINQYANDYAAVWQQWLAGVRLKPLIGMQQIVNLLPNIAAPLATIVQVVNNNTLIVNDKLPDLVLKNALQQALSIPLINQRDQQIVVMALASLTEVLQSLNSHPTNTIILWQNAQPLLIHLYNQINNLSPFFSHVLKQITTASVQLWLAQIHQDLIWQWHHQGAAALCRKIIQNYPFNTIANTDVTLKDFATLLAPNGVMANYYQHYLKIFINTHAPQWQWQTFNGLAISQNQSTPRQFERAYIIQQLYFNQQQVPAVNFSWQWQTQSANIQQASLSFNHQKITAQMLNFQWPFAGINLIIVDQAGKTYHWHYPGDWALFRLLDKVDKTKIVMNGPLHYAVTLPLANGQVTYQLIAHSPFNLFMTHVISGLRCPFG